MGIPPDFGATYAETLILAGQLAPAKQLIDSLTKARDQLRDQIDLADQQNLLDAAAAVAAATTALQDVIATANINLIAVNARVDATTGLVTMNFSVRVADFEQLSALLARLAGVPNVIEARRVA